MVLCRSDTDDEFDWYLAAIILAIDNDALLDIHTCSEAPAAIRVCFALLEIASKIMLYAGRRKRTTNIKLLSPSKPLGNCWPPPARALDDSINVARKTPRSNGRPM